MENEKRQRLIALRDSIKDYGYTDGVEELESIFPELKESEKERIRVVIEGIIRVYGKTQGEWCAGYDMDTLVAHLRDAFDEEKEEQKPAENKAFCYPQDLALHDNVIYEGGRKTGQNEGVKLVLNNLEKYGLQKKQKPAEWSEEDEEMLNSCISSIEEAKENRYAYKETDEDTSYDHEINWLKSLKPQPHWKPSEEQMKALARATNRCVGVKDSLILLTMLNDLKKLM